MFDVICIGGATQDVFVRCEGAQIFRQSDRHHEKSWIAFNYGSKLAVEQLSFGVGGGATNTAVTFANLACKTACVVKVGYDSAGEQVIADLKQRGIDVSLIAQAEGQTGYSVILTSYEGERSVLAFRGLNRELNENDLNWDALKQSKWLYISSLSGPSEALLDPLVQFAAQHQIQVAINPGNRQLEKGITGLDSVLKQIDLLFLNREEATQLTGIDPIRPTEEALRLDPGHEVRPAYMYDLDEIFSCLKDHVRQAIVITDGKNGTQVYHQGSVTLMPVYPVDIVDVLGAGDAFASAFTTCWMRTTDIQQSLIWGAANGAGVISNPGAHNGLLNQSGIAAMQARFPQVQPVSYQL